MGLFSTDGEALPVDLVKRRHRRRFGDRLPSIDSQRSWLSKDSDLSILSTGSDVSIASAGSLISVLSAGSILSIGSAGSILSIGSAGSILSYKSAGSILSVRSIGSILSTDKAFANGATPGCGGAPDRAAPPMVTRVASMLAAAGLLSALTVLPRQLIARAHSAGKNTQ